MVSLRRQTHSGTFLGATDIRAAERQRCGLFPNAKAVFRDPLGPVPLPVFLMCCGSLWPVCGESRSSQPLLVRPVHMLISAPLLVRPSPRSGRPYFFDSLVSRRPRCLASRRLRSALAPLARVASASTALLSGSQPCLFCIYLLATFASVGGRTWTLGSQRRRSVPERVDRSPLGSRFSNELGVFWR
jgi:hypothetical protein